MVDCFFTREGPSTDFSSVEKAHRDIVEQVVEVDAALLERYLGGDEAITAAQLHDPFEKALREGHLVPVCFTSALTGAGVPELLNLILHLLPSPLGGESTCLFERRRRGRDASRGHSRSVIARSGACVQDHHRPLSRAYWCAARASGHGEERQSAVRRQHAQALQDRASLQRTGRRAEGDFRSSARRSMRRDQGG